METTINDKYDNSRLLLEEAGDLEREADMFVTNFEEAENKRRKARTLRSGAELNRSLRDTPYIGWFLSEMHYYFSIA